MIVLGIDPGLTSGFALWDSEKQAWLNAGEIKLAREIQLFKSSFADWLFAQQGLDVIVVENYIQRPNFMAKNKETPHELWTKQTTAKLIGMVHMMGRFLEIPVVEQEPSIKPVGYGVAQIKYVPGKKSTHITDAMAHARYYIHALEGRVRANNES